MKKLLLFVTFLVFVCTACQEESFTEDKEETNLDKFATVTVDQTGGSVTFRELEVLIPEGAFQKEYTLRLEEMKTEIYFGEDEASKFYVIKDIPVGFSSEIYLLFDVPDNADGVYFAFGEYGIKKGVEEEQLSFSMYEPYVYEGQMVFELPVISEVSNADDKVDVTIGLVKNFVNTEGTKSVKEKSVTASKTVKCYMNKSYADAYSNFDQMSGYFGDAFNIIENKLGFSFAKRTKWPVKVTVEELGGTIDGLFSSSVWGDNYGTIQIDIDVVREGGEKLKATIVHELFHLAQDLYDDRWGYSRAKFSDDYLWLDEAASTMSERFASPTPNDYFSIVSRQQYDRPLLGLKHEQTAAQGYGLSTFITYYYKHIGENSLVEIYKKRDVGKDAYEALNEVAGTKGMNGIYFDYIKKHLTGKLGNLGEAKASIFQNLYNSQVYSNTGNDSLVVDVDINPLSCKIFKIVLKSDGYADKEQLIVRGKHQSNILLFKHSTTADYELVNETTAFTAKAKILSKNEIYYAVIVNTGNTKLENKITMKVEKPTYNAVHFLADNQMFYTKAKRSWKTERKEELTDWKHNNFSKEWMLYFNLNEEEEHTTLTVDNKKLMFKYDHGFSNGKIEQNCIINLEIIDGKTYASGSFENIHDITDAFPYDGDSDAVSMKKEIRYNFEKVELEIKDGYAIAKINGSQVCNLISNYEYNENRYQKEEHIYTASFDRMECSAGTSFKLILAISKAKLDEAMTNN